MAQYQANKMRYDHTKLAAAGPITVNLAGSHMLGELSPVLVRRLIEFLKREER